MSRGKIFQLVNADETGKHEQRKNIGAKRRDFAIIMFFQKAAMNLR